jgi:hypothetical protein
MDVVCQFHKQEDGTNVCRVCGLRAPSAAVRPVAKCYGPGGLPQSQPQPIPPSDGPGTRLKALLRDWLGIEASPTCSCNAMARRMDSQPVEWSESDEGMAEILGVMREEHAKRRAAGKTVLPWTDTGARQLVLLACRRSRVEAAKNSG